MSTLLRNILLAMLTLACAPIAAHDGGLDANGCHHDRKGHHCHRDGQPQSQPAQHPDGGRPERSLDDTGRATIRDCTAARASCAAIEQSVDGTGPLSASSAPWEEARGTKHMPTASGLGVLMLAGLFAWGVYTLRGLQGRRSQHRH
jgi:hypothetical protein